MLGLMMDYPLTLTHILERSAKRAGGTVKRRLLDAKGHGASLARGSVAGEGAALLVPRTWKGCGQVASSQLPVVSFRVSSSNGELEHEAIERKAKAKPRISRLGDDSVEQFLTIETGEKRRARISAGSHVPAGKVKAGA